MRLARAVGHGHEHDLDAVVLRLLDGLAQVVVAGDEIDDVDDPVAPVRREVEADPQVDTLLLALRRDAPEAQLHPRQHADRLLRGVRRTPAPTARVIPVDPEQRHTAGLLGRGDEPRHEIGIGHDDAAAQRRARHARRRRGEQVADVDVERAVRPHARQALTAGAAPPPGAAARPRRAPRPAQPPRPRSADSSHSATRCTTPGARKGELRGTSSVSCDTHRGSRRRQAVIRRSRCRVSVPCSPESPPRACSCSSARSSPPSARPAPRPPLASSPTRAHCKSNGLLRAVASLSECKNNETKVTVKPGPTPCASSPSGSTRLAKNARDCKSPATTLTVPPTSGTVYFCAAIPSGTLRYVSGPGQCLAGEVQVQVTPNDAAPSVTSTSPADGATRVATSVSPTRHLQRARQRHRRLLRLRLRRDADPLRHQWIRRHHRHARPDRLAPTGGQLHDHRVCRRDQ